MRLVADNPIFVVLLCVSAIIAGIEGLDGEVVDISDGLQIVLSAITGLIGTLIARAEVTPIARSAITARDYGIR